MTRQCCYGYGRARGASYATPCEKIDIKDIAITAEDMGAKEFINRAKSMGLMDMFATRRNFTVFLPVDEAFNTFSDLLQSESVRNAIIFTLPFTVLTLINFMIPFRILWNVNRKEQV